MIQADTFGVTCLTLLPAAVIPPFHDAVDNAVAQLAADGLLGVADFFVSGKYDTPMRQMHWGRRFFWRWVDRTCCLCNQVLSRKCFRTKMQLAYWIATFSVP